MQRDKEKKIFLSVLWVFLVGSLIFFISFLQFGRIFLPAPIWLMFLFLDAGFIIFLFLPLPGRAVSGPPGRKPSKARWYPRSLADIVEATGARDRREEGILEPVRAISPVPLIPLLMLLVVIVLAAPIRPDAGKWKESESARLENIYGKAEKSVSGLESLAGNLGARTAEIIGERELENMPAGERSRLVHRIDSLAGAVSAGLTPFHEIGIQVFSPSGERVVWGGHPRYLKLVPRGDYDARIYTSRTQMYTLLVRDMPLTAAGRVIVDVPLGVNYRISNQYLRSTSLGEILSDKYGDEVRFRFSMGEHGGDMRWIDEDLNKKGIQVSYDDREGVRVDGVVRSSAGLPLAYLRVQGDAFPTVLEEREGQKVFWAGLVMTLIVVIIARWVYHKYGKRGSREKGSPWNFIRRLVVLFGFLCIIRYLLLSLDIPSWFFGTNLFDPALFADEVPAGLMRTVGDFVITGLFALILVFGSIKTFRTYYPGHLEKPLRGGRKFRWILLAAKALLVFALLAVAMLLSSSIVSRVVLNSNPRLIGLDIGFFELPVLSLHLALLFIISAVFIAVLFLCRLILVWGGGSLMEGLPASGIALVLLLIVLNFHWALFISSAALLVLSVKIFPLIKKEELVSIIFSSFFLVVICSIVIYGVASDRYTELREGRVLEKAQDFNFPEDNWLEVILPDLCQDISSDRSFVSKIFSRKETAAFEIWAESSLSRFNLSCTFDVYDSRGRRFSHFEVGMPIASPLPLPEGPSEETKPAVQRNMVETRNGAVYYYRGTAPLYNINAERIGEVVITIPYFFENPELLARAGPMAPEILHNIERGALAPRIDEPENLLVARISGNVVKDSSTPLLVAGKHLPDVFDEWFTLDLGRERYNCLTMLRDDFKGFLVGYRSAGVIESLLTWATVVSLNVILTSVSFLALILVRKLPILRSLIPAVSISGGLGFREKILLSFLVVSILPILILGVFSGRFIQRNFRLEGEREALASVSSAVSLINHSIMAEAESFAGSRHVLDILGGDADVRMRDAAAHESVQFILYGGDGELLMVENMGDFEKDARDYLLDGENVNKVTVVFEHPYLYGGVVIPVSLPDGRGGHIYYRRRLDDEFVEAIAGVLGKDISIYYNGIVQASSEMGLFMGGFMDPLVPPVVFADIALSRSRAVVLEATLGDYSYQVASSPLASLRNLQSGVLSVPMIYQTALVRKDILKTSALILGLLALLFAAAVTLGVFLAGKIFTPIAVLRGGTRRIIDGDLEFKLEAEAPDEIGELVDSFNTMTAALRDARRDLLERQRYLSAVLDNVATGVMAVDSGNKVITLNPSGERILDLSRSEVVGRRPGEIGGGGLESLIELFSEGEKGISEKEITLFSGERRRTIKAVVTGLDAEGEKLGTVVVFDDLTELIRSKKLAAWVEMARQIAHEVKNPLTPIKLSAQLMQRAYEEGSGEFGEIFRSGIETVIQQTEILRRISSEFSSFGKATSLKREEISVNEFLGRFTASYRGAEGIEVSYSPGEDLRVNADREALRKILVNLMENALEAMPGGGEVTLTYRRSGDMVEIEVGDEGPGLPQEIRERLFEPYFSTKTNGTGLGLAICQNLAREMEGDIRLRNKADRAGVKAIVALPLAR